MRGISSNPSISQFVLAHRKLKPPLTPAIFTKKNQQIKIVKPTTPYLIAFENYLNLVSQQYYKASFSPAEVSLAEEDQGYFKLGDAPPILINPRPGRPGRKPKPKLPVMTEESKEQGMENKDASNSMPIEQDKQNGTDLPRTLIDKYSAYYIDVLDTLVSPIKQDYPFGN